MQTLGQKMHALMSELFPICRSLTGNGVRETLQRIQKEIPLSIREVPSGTRCFDWTVPKEWNIRDAFIKDPSGKKIVDFGKSNLHVVSYSIPFKGKVSLDVLKKHLYTLPSLPNAIPYVTSYYQERWGFCLRHEDYLQLKEGEYDVFIDSELKEGSLTYGELLIPGKSEDEILLSTYICHPSMANNELSGPVLTTYLAKELLKLKAQRYSYRILFIPETIGAIVYLSQNLETMKKNTRAGYVVTCTGAPGEFTYLFSRDGNTLVDRTTTHVLKHCGKPSKTLPFLERGSDERQYCWPGVDLPVGSLMKPKYGEFPQYHNSLDNLEFCTAQALEDSFQVYFRCLEAMEKNHIFKVTTVCEPQLGKRGLYRTEGTTEYPPDLALLCNFLAYCDGNRDLLAHAELLGRPIEELFKLAELCLKENLIVLEENCKTPIRNLRLAV